MSSSYRGRQGTNQPTGYRAEPRVCVRCWVPGVPDQSTKPAGVDVEDPGHYLRKRISRDVDRTEIFW